MLRSMFAGVSGLRNHQIKMDVLGNNIANVNTYGYKASRVTFQEIYTQSIRSASQPSQTGNVGGRNPMQIGLGVSTATIDVIHTGAGNQMTDSGLDMAIDGEGFFAVNQGTFTYYTRVGNFALNPTDGALVNGNGFFVQGIMFIDDVDNTNLPDTINKVDFDDTLDDTYEIDPETVGKIFIPEGYDNVTIDARGIISGTDDEGNLINIGQILLTTFVNPAGLTRSGSNLYMESGNSGEPMVGLPGDLGVGFISSSYLEMSNVDLSKEFTDMIITQRGFQANSRVITVSDTLLEELINLKR